MGQLIEGKWHDDWYDTEKSGGRFVRAESGFRGWVTSDGSSGFKAEAGRYHLYASLACPWAHRVLIMRKLKRLEEVISVSVVGPLMLENGWSFDEQYVDDVNGASHLHQIYTKADPQYSGRVTVPVLWDRKTESIINNESSELLRMLNSEFNSFTTVDYDYYPVELRNEIDERNERVYHGVNNGVYKAGFATTQKAYEEAVAELFTTLDDLEELLSGQPYLTGGRITETDWRLFTTLIRFDLVYVGHFKCNLRRLVDYPNLLAHTRRLYRVPGVSETVDPVYIKKHYYGSHKTINPTGIVPKGPERWL